MSVNKYDWIKLQSEYDSGKSTYDLHREFGVCQSAFAKAKYRGEFKPRTTSQAYKIAYASGKINPSKAWTPELRKKQSDAKKKLYSEHPEKHPNRKLANNRVNMSYPERLVFDHLISRGIAFDHNRKIDKYFVDFCIGSLVIEVDGVAFHDHDYDVNRDSIISELGFTIKRFDAKAILKFGPSIVLDNTYDQLMYKNIELRIPHKCPVCEAIYYGKRKFCSDVCKCINRRSRVQSTSIPNKSRVTTRPTEEMLRTLIQSESFISIGKRFGVSDNAVRKWCKDYFINTKSRKELSDIEVTEMINSGVGVCQIATRLGVSRERIKTIANRLGLVIESHNVASYSPEVVSKVLELILQGYRNVDIIPLVGLNQKQISTIRCRFRK